MQNQQHDVSFNTWDARTDQGSQFVNEIMEEPVKLIGVEHQFTLQYSKEESAIIERANKEVMRCYSTLTRSDLSEPFLPSFCLCGMKMPRSNVTAFPKSSCAGDTFKAECTDAFMIRCTGPLRVVGVVNKNTHTLQNLVTLKTHDVHVTQLKPFQYDATETDPADMARKEEQEFLVEHILQHRGGPKRSTLEFYVKWTWIR